MSSGMRTVRFARHSGHCRSSLAVIPSLSRNLLIVLLIADALLCDGQYLATPYIYRHGIAKNICSALDFCIYLRPVLGETFELIIKILELNILNEINYVLDT